MKEIEESKYYQDKRKYDKYLEKFNSDKEFMNDFNKKFLKPMSFKEYIGYEAGIENGKFYSK